VSVQVSVAVQTSPFELAEEYAQLRSNNLQDGATALFVGSVRDFNDSGRVQSLELEHYSGMTERVLVDIANNAGRRWHLGRVRIVHRVGRLDAGEDIVLVAVSAEHRAAALEACAFIMDWLKSRVPIWKKESWKKETNAQEDNWVEARQSDEEALQKW
jgi:molybdopterin synthase catalytic subunit